MASVPVKSAIFASASAACGAQSCRFSSSTSNGIASTISFALIPVVSASLASTSAARGAQSCRFSSSTSNGPAPLISGSTNVFFTACIIKSSIVS
eukprot:7376322-Prymnesium_polylepis.1